MHSMYVCSAADLKLDRTTLPPQTRGLPKKAKPAGSKKRLRFTNAQKIHILDWHAQQATIRKEQNLKWSVAATCRHFGVKDEKSFRQWTNRRDKLENAHPDR